MESSNESGLTQEMGFSRLWVIKLLHVITFLKWFNFLFSISMTTQAGGDNSDVNGDDVFYESNDKWVKDYMIGSPVVRTHG